jgi:hypothetical protein
MRIAKLALAARSRPKKQAFHIPTKAGQLKKLAASGTERPMVRFMELRANFAQLRCKWRQI